ncbi:hydrogenase maturation protein HypF [Legionella birminghamensis]|uniref:Carbamoyltransferase HypF n=1 Tax=Legionella birminghamensis TaxID=28083 RepID=A0A378I9D9_9GAMM|nr:carbamoyltransferase HypF [Legionella birminghamensis]KTC74858.1 hydrogenase maturation protein HypF [Legionella birminghamensis]STX31759.1 hydrogenase maturation protein HypF [Legionella birminghamensis]
MEVERLQLIIQGQVQGVGFRPCVFRVAKRLRLTGWIQNNASGVLIEVQGALACEFEAHLKENLPPLAKVNTIQQKIIPLKINETFFEIIESENGKANTIISPDTCICSECLQDLFDPQSRYFRYPFLNCTQCGPRFSITQTLPYDRCHTSMEPFPFCQDCYTDYTNPENRRYHAQPTACVNCGPQLSLSIEDIAECILQGEIIALKGLGGYQLICDAKNEKTLLKLRERKNRETKPLALMVANSKSAEPIVEISKQAQILLEGAARPIVLLRKKEGLGGIEKIAPGLNHLGIMLPYTPLHYLLFNAFAGNLNGCGWLDEFQSTVLVVTSANPGGEPIIIDDYRADCELKSIADKIVSYNRLIIAREDDSVLRIVNDAPMFIRRSRGFVPAPIQLPYSIPPTLAVGGHLKNTFCITRGDEAFVSQHIGSLTNKATIDFFHESLTHLLDFLDVEPERIAHDLHPDFYTTRFAEDYGVPAFAIQHHHAHLASVAAEHGIKKQVLGLALDGYGYGANGEAWGGELLLLENAAFERLGSFYPFLQPGGEIVAREPWRMAASVLHRLGRGNDISKRFSGFTQASAMHQLLDKEIICPSTSSCGRLFDAASALLGIQLMSQYEGQAAMQLESLVTELLILPKGWRIQENNFDLLPLLEVLSELADPIKGANLFHGTLIAGLSEWIKDMCREQRIDMVVLSGGCFLNQILAEGLTKALIESGIKPFLPRSLPPNDGGISLGQAWITGILQG